MRGDGGGEPPVAPVAVIGLGGMGSRIAGRLLEAGFEVIVWNRSPDKALPLVERGAVAVETPAEAGVSTATAPRSTSGSALSGDRFQTITSNPASSSRPAIRLPIPPSPITATGATGGSPPPSPRIFHQRACVSTARI